MTILICGSIAYDTMMVFPGQFKDWLVLEQTPFNVSFPVQELRREFGGCAGNIAYQLQLLGETPLPMATVGSDFEPYRIHCRATGISLTHVHEIADQMTAQAVITTDQDHNQITAFHPGAMASSSQLHVSDAQGVQLGLVSPDHPPSMLQHAQEFVQAGWPFIFDPGQAVALFTGSQLRTCLSQADYVVVNDYESQMLQRQTGWSSNTIVQQVKAYIVTKGAQGAVIHTQRTSYPIPAVSPARLIDPTGCGDAFRAGLLFGLIHHLDWPTIGRLGVLLGARQIACPGTQNHQTTLASVHQEFIDLFAYQLLG